MRFVIFVLGVVVGVVGFFAYGVFVAPSPAPTHPIAVAPPVPLPSHAPLTVTLDETVLTALMQRAIANAPAANMPGIDVPKTQVRVELAGDRIVVHASVEVLGAPTEGTVTLRPVVRAGRLAIDVVETNLGAIALPAMDDVLASQINARLQPLFDGLPVTVSGVAVEAKGLVVTCQLNLDAAGPSASR